jgi:predicted naringenin-chalcone synthase
MTTTRMTPQMTTRSITRPAILGIGCATPPHTLTQSQAAEMLIAMASLDGTQASFARRVHRGSGIDRRASVILDATAPLDEPVRQSFFGAGAQGDPTTGVRMRIYNQHAPALAIRAGTRALQDAQLAHDPGSITHLVTVSCTGFGSPGVDVDLIAALGLGLDVSRLHIGYMGCHGGVVALRAADAIVRAGGGGGGGVSGGGVRPPRVLVVCIELCSLHMQQSGDLDAIVANALFADGAAACVMGSVEEHADGCENGHADHHPLRVLCGGSRLFPETRGLMGWTIGDHGFAMTLGEGVPRAIREQIRPWLIELLHAGGHAIAEDALDRMVRWGVHPGGPRVLDAVAEALVLEKDGLTVSRGVLREHGNMSSATILFILERMRALPQDQRPVVLVGFGPGLTAEAVVLGR